MKPLKPLLFLILAPVLWSQPGDFIEKARWAADLVAAGKPEEAVPLYQGLVRAVPNDAGIWLNLSIAEFKSKRYADAAAHAAASLKIRPDSPAANLFLGSSYEEMGEYAKAIDPLEKTLAVWPKDRNARLMFAEALLHLDRFEPAAEQFEKVVELVPENAKAWYGLGRAYEELSERIFRQLGAENPDSPYWYALAGDRALMQKRYGSAFTHYRKALDVPGVHASLAEVYERTGHAEWAKIERQKESAGRPLRETSNAPETLYSKHQAYARMAREAYGRLLALPPSLEAHLYKAKTFEAHEAASEWREALRLAPGDVHIATALAWSLFRANEFDSALAIVKELLPKQGNSPELNFLYGAVLLNLGEPEKATSSLQAAIRLDGNFLPAQAALGQALLQAGKPALAIPHLQAALSGDEKATARFGLYRAYQLTGQTDLAVRAKLEYEKTLTSGQQENATILAP